MLRGIISASGRLAAGGAAVAAAASPELSHARALQPRPVLPGGTRDDEAHRLIKTTDHAKLADADWLLAQVRDGNVYCEEADIKEAVDEMLGQSFRAHVVDAESSEEDERSSCTSFGASADELMERADQPEVDQITPVLTTLLNNEEVQQSIFKALKEDENFNRFLQTAPGPSRLLLPPSTVLIEEVADAEVRPCKISENRGNPFQGAMNKIGSGLIKLGEDLKNAGEHLGGMFVGLGNKLRNTIVGASAHTKKAIEEPNSHKDFWMNALGVLAVAVLTMLFAKGKLRVRTA